MKTYKCFFVTAIVLSAIISCSKEIAPETEDSQAPETTEAPASGRNFQTLVAAPAEGAVDVDSKTAFVGGTFMWKKNNNIVVRSNNANGFTTYKYTGEDTADEAEFTRDEANSEDRIVTGNNSFAYYPAKTSGSGATAYPREEDGSLKLVLKDGYTWFEGNVEAPMLAKVTDDGTALQFKHLGGVLKVTYKYVPPKAAKLVISAPASGEDQYYKIIGTQRSLSNWETSAGGFTGETPYLQAYSVTGKKELTQTITAATAAQRASDSGLSVYIPLPVGPGDAHTYPEIDVRLTFADGTTVPGSERVAKNVKIERATIKKMQPITLTKYSVEVVAGTDGSNATTDGTGTAAKFNQVRGLCWLDNTNILATESNGSKVLRQFNKSTKVVTSPVTLGGNAPWQGCMKDGLFYFIDKGNAQIRTWNPSTNAVATVTTSVGNSPMCIRFNGNDAYVVSRNDSKVYKFAGGPTGTKSVFFDFSTLEHGEDTNWPIALVFDGDGNAIVTVGSSKGTSATAFMVYVIAPDGSVVTTIGKHVKAANFAATYDGAPANASFSANMNGITLGPDGALYMVDSYAIRRITKGSSGWSDATVTTILGGGSSYLTSVGAACLITQTPQDIVFDPENSNVFYFFDWRYTIRKVTIE